MLASHHDCFNANLITRHSATPSAPFPSPSSSPYIPSQKGYSNYRPSISSDIGEDPFDNPYEDATRSLPIANPPGIVRQPSSRHNTVDPKVIEQIENACKWRPWFCWI